MASPNRSEFPSKAPVVQQPVADVRAPELGQGNQVTYTFPIRQPEEDLNDFQVGIRASLLRRCRGRLESVTLQYFPFSEVLLGLSTLAAGGFMSAIVSGVSLDSWLGFLFLVCLPPVAVGCGVAYAMLRHFTMKQSQEVARNVLMDLPDPDRARDVKHQ